MRRVVFFLGLALTFTMIDAHQCYEALSFSSTTTLCPTVSNGLKMDTLNQYFKRSKAFKLYILPSNRGVGYCFGNGYDTVAKSYLSTETGMHYDGVKDAKVKEVLVRFAVAKAVNDPDNVVVKIYSVNKDTVPTTELGSASLKITDLKTNSEFTSFPLQTPVNTKGEAFLVSVVYDKVDDTLCIDANDIGTKDGNGERRSRTKFSAFVGAGWKAMMSVITNLDCDAMIIPVVEGATSVHNPLVTKSFSVLTTAYDNTLKRMSFTLRNTSDATLGCTIFTLDGTTVYHHDFQKNGSNITTSVSTKGWASGSYYYTIKSGNDQITGKFVVNN